MNCGFLFLKALPEISRFHSLLYSLYFEIRETEFEILLSRFCNQPTSIAYLLWYDIIKIIFVCHCSICVQNINCPFAYTHT